MGKTTGNSNHFASTEPCVVFSDFIHEMRHIFPEIPIPGISHQLKPQDNTIGTFTEVLLQG